MSRFEKAKGLLTVNISRENPKRQTEKYILADYGISFSPNPAISIVSIHLSSAFNSLLPHETIILLLFLKV